MFYYIVMKKIVIDWIEYVEKSVVEKLSKAEDFDWMEYVMCRTYSAWVFAWYLEKRKWQEVILRQARRMRYWSWASSLSQLATDGTSDPDNCKFPCEVDKVELLQVVEIIPITEKAYLSIKSVKVWKM